MLISILCSLDEYVLEQCCVSIDSLQKINEIFRNSPEAILDKNLLISKEKHEKTFFRCCDELCLSPQARAKVAAANAAVAEDGTKALLDILSGGEDEE